MKTPKRRPDKEAYARAVALSRRAEKHVQEAISDKEHGEMATTVDVSLRKALKLSEAAAKLVEPFRHVEPARSQLFYNVAKLAWGLAKMDAAEDFIFRALKGDPPPENINKLLALRNQVHNIKKATTTGGKKGGLAAED